MRQIQKNISLAQYTTFNIGGPAKYLITIENTDELIKGRQFAKEKGLPYFILGGGSNLLVSDEGFDGVVIKMQNKKIRIQNSNTKFKILDVDAGRALAQLVDLSVKNRLTGLEWAVGIPGTIGGAVCGNAGSFGQNIAQKIQAISVLAQDYKIQDYHPKDVQFAYRYSIFKNNPDLTVVSVRLRLNKGNREQSQTLIRQYLSQKVRNNPRSYPSAGCVFKNYQLSEHDNHLNNFPQWKEKIRNGKIPAAFLIEQVGLRGKRIGRAQVSEKHANFIINLGGAKAKDVFRLISLAKKLVKEKFDIVLEEEIDYLGF